jgi:hypothetical protein
MTPRGASRNMKTLLAASLSVLVLSTVVAGFGNYLDTLRAQ